MTSSIAGTRVGSWRESDLAFNRRDGTLWRAELSNVAGHVEYVGSRST
ncbi:MULTISPECIES: hypothetical protein [Streptomyces]